MSGLAFPDVELVPDHRLANGRFSRTNKSQGPVALFGQDRLKLLIQHSENVMKFSEASNATVVFLWSTYIYVLHCK